MLLVKEKELQVGIDRAHKTCPETKDECYCCVTFSNKGYVRNNELPPDMAAKALKVLTY